MIQYGINTFAHNVDNQGSNNNASTTKYLESSTLLMATTYDFENPLYAKEGLISKIVKKVKKFANR
jgi:hypothetical protein